MSMTANLMSIKKALLSNSAGFMIYPGRYTKFPCSEGWKFHVGAAYDETADIAEAVLPVLRKHDFWHKLPETLNGYQNSKNAKNGKFITIYSTSYDEANTIDDVLNGIRMLKTYDSGLKPKNEMYVLPSVYARYGALVGDLLSWRPGFLVSASSQRMSADVAPPWLKQGYRGEFRAVSKPCPYATGKNAPDQSL